MKRNYTFVKPILYMLFLVATSKLSSYLKDDECNTVVLIVNISAHISEFRQFEI